MNVKTRKIAVCAILVGVTIVLQTLAALFPLKVFGISVSLVMIPIAVAVMLYGYFGGAVVGGAFGLTVLIHCITGIDGFGLTLFEINPLYTTVATFLRGLLAGVAAAAVYSLTKKIKNNSIRYYVVAATAPIANTGLFVLLFSTLFNQKLNELAVANNVNALYFVLIILVGANFLFEFISTIVIAPPVCKALTKLL